MKTFLVSVLLCLAACSPPPQYPTCDYCRKPKQDARIYACRKCGNSHSSCGVESPLHALDVRKDKEGFATGRSIKMCPEGAPK